MKQVDKKTVLINKIMARSVYVDDMDWLEKLSLDELSEMEDKFVSVDNRYKKFLDNKSNPKYKDYYDNRMYFDDEKHIWNFARFFADYKYKDLENLKMEYVKYRKNCLYFYFPWETLRKDDYFRENFIEEYPAIYDIYSRITVDSYAMVEAPFIHISPLNFSQMANITNFIVPFIELQDKKFARINAENGLNRGGIRPDLLSGIVKTGTER